MKKYLLISATAMLANSLLAADASPKDDVIAAAKKLGEQANYGWKSIVVVPEGSRSRQGPVRWRLSA